MKTYDVNVKGFTQLVSPDALKDETPIPEGAARTVIEGRKEIEEILAQKDKRLLMIVGPCSIHDVSAAMDYARMLKTLREEVKDKINLIMRVYFEKPRTTVGWKGLINDPDLNSSYDINRGLRIGRKLLIDINEMGIPTATEILDPIVPHYIAGLLTWVAIGARTTESQTHREMASGLSMPVGFKNSTDGSLDAAINAMTAAGSPQHFLGIDGKGLSSIVSTTGNSWAHIVLRGGVNPNYDPLSVDRVLKKLSSKNLLESVLIDCSHDNSGQRFKGQPYVFKAVLDQRRDGNDNIIGLMLESNIHEGNQKCTGDRQALKYGVSITDECISWETTEELIRSAYERL